MQSNLLEVSPADYHSKLKFNRDDMFAPDSYLSKSVLWSSYGVSLWYFKNHIKPFKPTVAMQWGSVIDMLTTTPEEADSMIVSKQYDSYRTNEAKEWRDEQLEAGRLILSAEDYMKAMCHADMLLNQHPVSSKIFADSKKQVILHCKTKEGINLKGLADLIPSKDFLCDLKTTADFSLSGFGKTCAKFGYHVQAGLYLIMWNNMFPDDQRKRFVHIWQDSSTGEVAVTEMSMDDILTGQAMARHLLARLSAAYKLDYFPMLTDDEMPVISRPTWAQIDDEIMLEGQEARLSDN